MAEITRVFFVRHLRGEQSSHFLHYSGGKLRSAGRGLSFWFLPMSASVSEVPADDREQPFLFHGRTADFQDVTVQGAITFRVVDPERIAKRVDFTIDLREGRYLKTPLETLSGQLVQLAQQFAESAVRPQPIRALMESGFERVQEAIRAGIAADPGLADLGIEVVSVRIGAIKPTAELERALQMPTFEKIQEAADLATFQRRALAVENERAIAENELRNKIELARRQEELIGLEGANRRREASETAEAQKIEVEAQAQRTRINADAQAGSIRVVGDAQVASERERMEIYRSMPSQALLGLAARELAGHIDRIEHLNVTPELLGTLLTELIEAGTKKTT